ncbi:MAG: ABC transporter permease [Candidatus Bipolaricaulota bacterium]
MKQFAALARTELNVFLRDRATFLVTFLFPLVFILIFGFLMGGEDVERVALGIYLTEDRDAGVLEDAAAQREGLRHETYPSRDALEKALQDREVDMGVVWDGEELTFLYDPAMVQRQAALSQLAAGLASDFNLRRQGLNHMLVAERHHVGLAAAANWFNMMVPAIIAFSILSAGIFAVSGHITAMKERKILDRLTVTPMRPLAFLLAVMSVRLAVVYISTLITLFTAMGVFNVDFQMDWPLYTLFVAASTLGMMGFGALITLVVRRPSSASNVANVLVMVMMFMSGIFFPVEIMPPFLQVISHAFPLTYMAEGLRFTTGVIDMAPARFLAITAALAGLALLLLPALARYVVRPERH